MLEAMWMWGAIGIILLAIEMATGTFYLLWLGVAALCVAVTLWLLPNLSEAVQYTMFAVLSLGSLAVWRLYYTKIETYTRVGQAQGEEIGRVGVVIEATGPTQNGAIRFTQGLMGSREWVAISNEVIPVGCNAAVVAVEGNTLRIQAV